MNPGLRVCVGRAERLAAFETLAAFALLGALLLGASLIWGCADRSGAQGGGHEVRLTTDGLPKHTIRFSPDGRWIAYTARPSGEKEIWSIFVIPRAGGEARRISPDALPMFGLAWAADGKGLYCRGGSVDSLYYVGLDGSLRALKPVGPFTRLAGITPDGQTELLLRFNGDNRDVAVRKDGEEAKFVAETPEWEENAVFGPGPGEITAVQYPSFQAPTSRISIWSPKSQAYSPLPLPEGQNGQPAWAPGGKHLVYVSYVNGQASLWVYDAQNARAVPLTSDSVDVASPSWSPDGEWLGFCRTSQTSHLFIGNPEKNDIRPLTEGPARDYGPCTSPDGQWVAFMRVPPAGRGARSGPRLCVVATAGGPATELDLKDVRVSGKDAEAMCWSPDSREIVFQGSDGSGKTDIYRVGRDGRGLIRVTLGPGDEVSPMWSPDGRRIAYTQAGSGRLQVDVVPANGGLPVLASHPKAQSEGGAWAPDSDRLAYIAYRADGTFELWVTSLAHPGTRRKILEDKKLVYPYRWAKDGQDLVLVRRAPGGWFFTAYSLAARRETKIGATVMLPSGQGGFVDFTREGEKYRDLFCPGGVCVLSDGKETTDIYLMKVRGLLESRLLAAAKD